MRVPGRLVPLLDGCIRVVSRASMALPVGMRLRLLSKAQDAFRHPRDGDETASTVETVDMLDEALWESDTVEAYRRLVEPLLAGMGQSCPGTPMDFVQSCGLVSNAAMRACRSAGVEGVVFETGPVASGTCVPGLRRAVVIDDIAAATELSIADAARMLDLLAALCARLPRLFPRFDARLDGTLIQMTRNGDEDSEPADCWTSHAPAP